MRELAYLSTAKLGEFRGDRGSGLSGRAVEAEVSALGVGGRLSIGEAQAGSGSPEESLEQVISHVQGKSRAHNLVPGSCASLMARDWMEFTGLFRFGPRRRDLGLVDRGVYTFMSIEDTACSLKTGEEQCSGVELILCGSRQHVLTGYDCPPTRMGSGSDWLHDLAAELVAREERGDISFPGRLSSTSRRDQEFAARSSYSMMADYYEGPAYFHGHARVLCNFEPDRFQHRLIVATPLYVEVAPRPERAVVGGVIGRTGRGWRKLMPPWG
ncbi:SAVMC3_10250 family protein [Streptomyces albus]|uniref:SAVMC3_10250 family protein n=1 Tax=Streptomyces sp. NRRL F-5639 TaxID=1463867 RepID=UPI000997F2B2